MEEITIKENIQAVKETIARACEKSGRKAEDVTLIAVDKTSGNAYGGIRVWMQGFWGKQGSGTA